MGRLTLALSPTGEREESGRLSLRGERGEEESPLT